jgi:hypothetical protein
MTKMAPIISDKFYVTEQFRAEDSMASIISDAAKSNVSMNSIKSNNNAMNTGNSHMSVDRLSA